MIARHFRPVLGLIVVLTLISALSACSGSKGADSSSSGRAASAAPATSNSTPNAAAPSPSAPAQTSASPTPNPLIKQAQAKPGVPVNVPESMKRPLTAEEMQKALQQLPPEVRSRIMGMQKLPPPSPSPARK